MQINSNERRSLGVTWLLCAIFAVELIRTAWLSDDSLITLRTVENLLHGFGPVFNVGERVQAYTHPLWFLIISAITFVTRNAYYTTYFISIAMSLGVMYVLCKFVVKPWRQALLAGAVLIFSKAFVDYSTSGLENPLSHLLILGAFVLAEKAIEEKSEADAGLHFFMCGLLYLTRPDLLIFIAPVSLLVVHSFKDAPRRLIRPLVVGGLPIVGWTAFSLFYYGFPFPNTAYAKLGTGIGLWDRIFQGVRYLLDSITRDPITILACILSASLARFSSKTDKALAAGVGLYCAYVVSIGGDFMSGRFLTAPLLGAVIVIGRSKIVAECIYCVAVGLLLIALPALPATLLSNADYKNTEIPASGITDERGYYFHKFGLSNTNRDSFKTPPWSVGGPSGEQKTYIICGGLGAAGIEGGPTFHFIDNCGLADPLLARLPAKYDGHWRIGHFFRQLPENYELSVQKSENLLVDKVLASYYDDLKLVTQAPLTAPNRFNAIVRLNTQKITGLERYRFTPIAQSSDIPAVAAIKFSTPVPNDIAWNAEGNLLISNAVDLVLRDTTTISGFDVSLSAGGKYRIEFLSHGRFFPIADFGEAKKGGGMITYKYEGKPFNSDRIRIRVLSGSSEASLGYLRSF